LLDRFDRQSDRSRREEALRTGPGLRWAGVAVLVLIAALFSFLNSSARVTLDVGFTELYQISLVGLVFGSFLLGMIAMFLFGLRYDRKVRDTLRDHARRARSEFLPPVSIPIAPGPTYPVDLPREKTLSTHHPPEPPP